MRKKKASGTTTKIGSDALTELALDLRWSWHHGADELWSQLDPELWALTHNPWVVLQVASPARLEELLARGGYRGRVKQLLEQRREHLASPAWFQQQHPQAPLTRVAYFSMLPIYSGGLGNVAGDQLKAASDLAVLVVGVRPPLSAGVFPAGDRRRRKPGCPLSLQRSRPAPAPTRGSTTRPTIFCRADRTPLCGLLGHGQHARLCAPLRPAHDPGQPALLGSGDARGPVPLRSRPDFRVGSPMAGCGGTRDGTFISGSASTR